MSHDYDFVVIGSGFGGSVSALRLSEKGYKVLVIEKGKRLGPDDFPSTNWNLWKWLWMPSLKMHGLFKMSVFRHVTIFSGVGVGGGSLVYANTLPVPKTQFYKAPSWAHLADWETELPPFYDLARRMLGATPYPKEHTADKAFAEIAKDIGKPDDYGPTDVAVFFGEPEVEVDDPFFKGEGPRRVGCKFRGACMLGCKHNAKNTLDKNYLYLAEKNGVKIQPEALVYDVIPQGGPEGKDGYEIRWKSGTRYFGGKGSVHARNVVFSGGALGTVPLLLDLKAKGSLPRISDQLGRGVRTNSESLLGVTTTDTSLDLSEGIAITSIIHIDDHSHVEPARYPNGSGFFRTLMSPAVTGRTFIGRCLKAIGAVISDPIAYLKVFFTPDWARYTQVFLFMQTLDSTLRFRRGIFGMRSSIDSGEPPTPFIEAAHEFAARFAEKVKGKVMCLVSETTLGMSSTAHILGGCNMGKDAAEGVIDNEHRVFGYENMYVCDGSAVSANPGVNPSLTITAMSERAMSKVAPAENAGEVRHIGMEAA